MSGKQLPTKEQAEQAHSFMLDQIHVPAFFEKLAANGIEPRNDAEAQQLLKLGAALATAEAEGQTKQATEGNPFLARLLDQTSPAASAEADPSMYIKQSADALVGDNQLAKTAALVYAHAVGGGELAAADATPAAE